MPFPRSSGFTVITADEVGVSAQMEEPEAAEADIKVRAGGVVHMPPTRNRNPENRQRRITKSYGLLFRP